MERWEACINYYSGQYMRKITLSIFIFLQFGCENNNPTITEEIRTLKTYPFSEPNPIPYLTKDKRLYPYHQIMGYAHKGTPEDWKVIKMENDHIEVYVLPEVGGKVWGAIDKANGQEFIYRNEVMKFRNIALRGPWTSGGIEFNFGVIGHTPSTATPVDYLTRTNPDGSVSTFVGAMDLPSRTHWRVEIRVEPNRANFETRALWYNPTPTIQAYYNWMTAAAFAQDDLEMVFPGDRYLKHSGEVLPWSIDSEERNLTYYDNNRFEGHKSYHVVGAWKNFFGGYYHNDGYGFGHWASQDEMPGQKLWLWALSDEGGIWEDHLTDTDGQYIEFQAGRQLVQYSPGDHENPIRKAGFDPYGADRWTEAWFPVGKLGGMVEVSKDGAMNVEVENGKINIKLHSFIQTAGTIKVVSKGRNIFTAELDLLPREIHEVTADYAHDFEVVFSELDLHYYSNPNVNRLDRSYNTKPEVIAAISKSDQDYRLGFEYLKERKHEKAETLFKSILRTNPNHLSANNAMADLYFRKAMIPEGLNLIRKNLSVDSYEAEANFIAGNLYRANKNFNDAREAFGWAARSMAYRSAAFAQIGEIYLIEKKWNRAVHYAKQALDFNRFNINALQVLVIANRKLGNIAEAKKWVDQLLWIDPLHHFANLEMHLLDPSNSNLEKLQKLIQNEFPEQTYLELAISYFNRGLNEEAVTTLNNQTHPMTLIWSAYLMDDPTLLEKAIQKSPAYIHPFRRESISVLEWAVMENDSWQFKYLLALNYWAKNREEDALELMNQLNNVPTFGAFYAARAALKSKWGHSGSVNDLELSLSLSPDSWPLRLNAINYHQKEGNWPKVLKLSSKAMGQFPENFDIEIMHARSLLYNDQLDACITVLNDADVLPSEMARESRQLFEWVHLAKAVRLVENGQNDQAKDHIETSREWPVHLGIGRPYKPDERLQNILSAYLDGEISQKNSIQRLKRLIKDKSMVGYFPILVEKAINAFQK